jgi:eukaryotic-like serine/threonine-protein kinase
VIHRDVKPTNILVDEDGIPKLLDFGIAKLLMADADAAPPTRGGLRLLTPEYAAPEQIEGGVFTAATDVYGLGAVLYELLTGARAVAATGRRSTESGSIPRPSTRLGAGRAGPGAERPGRAEAVATARRTTPERLRRQLRGDLDTIVQKALAPRPEDRYASPSQLAEDLERHQRALPVSARGPAVGYRIRRFARRHRLAVAASIAVIAALGASATFHTLRIADERDRAQAEAVRAQTTTRFLQRLLGDAYPSVARGESFSIDDLLTRAVARVDSLTDQPRTRADLLRTLGDIYREQGRFAEARPLLERAVELYRSSGVGGRELGDVLMALGHLYHDAQQYDEAVATHRESLRIFRQLLAPDDSLVLFATNNLATSTATAGGYNEALALHEEVVARRHRLFTDTSQLVHFTHNNLGNLYSLMDDLDASERHFREAVRLRRIAVASNHPSLGLSLNNLGTVLERLDHIDEAEAVHLEALGIFEEVFGEDHPRVGLSSYNLARIYEATGRLEEALALYLRAANIDRRSYGEAHLEVAVDLRRVGTVQRALGECPLAITSLRESDRLFEINQVPAHDFRRIAVRGELAMCLAAQGNAGEGVALLNEIDRAGREADAAWTTSTPGVETARWIRELQR